MNRQYIHRQIERVLADYLKLVVFVKKLASDTHVAPPSVE